MLNKNFRKIVNNYVFRNNQAYTGKDDLINHKGETVAIDCDIKEAFTHALEGKFNYDGTVPDYEGATRPDTSGLFILPSWDNQGSTLETYTTNNFLETYNNGRTKTNETGVAYVDSMYNGYGQGTPYKYSMITNNPCYRISNAFIDINNELGVTLSEKLYLQGSLNYDAPNLVINSIYLCMWIKNNDANSELIVLGKNNLITPITIKNQESITLDFHICPYTTQNNEFGKLITVNLNNLLIETLFNKAEDIHVDKGAFPQTVSSGKMIISGSSTNWQGYEVHFMKGLTQTVQPGKVIRINGGVDNVNLENDTFYLPNNYHSASSEGLYVALTHNYFPDFYGNGFSYNMKLSTAQPSIHSDAYRSGDLYKLKTKALGRQQFESEWKISPITDEKSGINAELKITDINYSFSDDEEVIITQEVEALQDNVVIRSAKLISEIQSEPQDFGSGACAYFYNLLLAYHLFPESQWMTLNKGEKAKITCKFTYLEEAE